MCWDFSGRNKADYNLTGCETTDIQVTIRLYHDPGQNIGTADEIRHQIEWMINATCDMGHFKEVIAVHGAPYPVTTCDGLGIPDDEMAGLEELLRLEEEERNADQA